MSDDEIFGPLSDLSGFIDPGRCTVIAAVHEAGDQPLALTIEALAVVAADLRSPDGRWRLALVISPGAPE